MTVPRQQRKCSSLWHKIDLPRAGMPTITSTTLLLFGVSRARASSAVSTRASSCLLREEELLTSSGCARPWEEPPLEEWSGDIELS